MSAFGKNGRDAIFEDRRGAMTGLAYRMLGSRADAEDVVQDAWIRWRDVDADEVANPAGFLNKVVTRLCLDRLKSARARREVYVGEWLPEPVVDEDHERLGEDLSVAFLLALERLTPLERAAFLLHDVFDAPFAEVAKTLGRTEAACRQLAARAREHVKAGKPRYRPSAEEEQRLTGAFLAAAMTGDETALRGVLARDVVMHSDGGGLAKATMNPVFGLEKAVRLMLGIKKKWPAPDDTVARLARINGAPGIVFSHAGVVFQTMGLEIVDGRIAAVYTMRNPEKLARLNS
ncbi:RNA polymerase subunit sigma [Caulobacter sp. Root1455]|jgi:RNA polymerase sigma-70 factor (ECF subfamily)|uniref:sigma-70 family RNA polymerase sigma factor n=1 Tax=unclassified Caulobacter TaxID=2648921 RepID=UPI0006F464C1|nr:MULTISPECIES: sigma-70 family RNA polymerase sigma factor [unclassified Caulobacter]KQY29308.1 RNA polymerase subunit sigma [Caulobacter sp. Root487D2Y]KQY96106.1 RNA polymerase subunit sigma [Caulobacter sp. Root1455]